MPFIVTREYFVSSKTFQDAFHEMERDMFRYPAGIIIVATLVTATVAEEKTRTTELESLQVELRQLQQAFGKDHPKVVAVRKRIGLLQRLGNEVTYLPEHKALIDRLSPMLLEEQELISKFGKGHPKVKTVRQRIEFTTKYFTDKLKRSTAVNEKKSGKTQSKHDAFLKMLPLLLKEQELIVRHGEKHASVANIRKQIARTRQSVGGSSRTSSVPGRTGQIPEDDNSPGVADDASKPDRFFMGKQNGNTILLDRETGRTWLMKTSARQVEWIPIRRGASSQP